ncbi:uncharacterized protein LOC115206504 [Salmo trutta]|uniref:uncharacterized protein LOC115206504 n=1 Tax=Salmo trutta TaxID=8032 RepID=UPI001132055D|nr:uncharacterized protein LOC115206504 [Salmo trutta]XP_029629431.1 uncharacterized protein LOC115206504 [Salmo trutta]XP_029629432.1 uncharacterized protein LOC115206504 [Salmo trutta]XP_029629434.1 uncharacterized protein LOC115206504 [Salmo trutta]
MDCLSDKSSSLALDQGQDSTISKMIGQPLDKSSSLGQGWDSTFSRMIGQLSGQSTSLDQGWDSTLSRMIGQLSNQLTCVSQLIGQMRLDQSSQWLDEGQDESWMMGPLVGELDESAAQWSGSSGADGSNSLGWVDLRGQTGVSSDPEGAPEAHSLSSSFLPGLEPLPHYQCLQHSGTSSQEADRTGASDSFHPLLAEVTHNKTAEPSMTFHLPEEEVEGPCSHEEESDHDAPAGDLELSACSVEFVDNTWSVTSDPPPECLRGREEPPQPSPALHDSLYQLTTSQCLPHNSALDVSPGAEVGGLAACSLSL